MRRRAKALFLLLVFTAFLSARQPKQASAHPVVLLLALAGLISLSDAHWPYADEIMETLNPFYEDAVLRSAWLEASEDVDHRVDVKLETAKMAPLVKLHGQLQDWTRQHGCVGKTPPTSSRKDSRAWKFCAQTDKTIGGVCALVHEKIGLMEARHKMKYDGLIKNSCRFNTRFTLRPSTP